MPLHFGQNLLSIPGPSVIPERVLGAMHRPSPNIYEGDLIEMTKTLIPDLKSLACSTGDVAIYIGNGHAAWEAALSNVLNANDKVLVLSSGTFAIGWGDMGKSLGLEIDLLDFGKQAAVDPDTVAAHLAQDTEHSIKAILIVQTDTASSVRNDISAVSEAIKSVGHPALFMVDCIASLATEEFRMDDWNVDVMVAACQKGMMVPAGLSFVYVSPRAQAARSQMSRVSSYWDWEPRTKPKSFRDLFGGTAPTHHLFGLREALNMLIHEEGLEPTWARHRVFARAVWGAVDAWGAAGRMHMNIADPDERSFAVTAITTADGDAGILRKWTEHVAGVTLGIGLGMAKPDDPNYGNYFRIGHMGHLSVPMVMGTLGAIDAGLKANKIPHGPGALAVAATAIAQG